MTDPERHDLVIVGAGPAGLTAAVGSEAENIDTLVLYEHLGGQAVTTSRIQNLPFYPDGVSGPDVMSHMIDTSLRFTTEFIRGRAEGIERVDDGSLMIHEDDRRYVGGAALISCGVESRRLAARNVDAYGGTRGVSNRAPNLALDYSEKKVWVVGGGNSAGQAAEHLSKFTSCEVNLVVRGDSLEKSMSAYLVEQVSANPKIDVHLDTEITAVDGRGRLQELTIRKGESEENVEADELFILIGADPRMAWLPSEVMRDQRGYVLAGHHLPSEVLERFQEEEEREPYAHETSVPGLFVAGDARHASYPRIAYAVGEGMAAATEIWDYLRLKPLRD